MTLSSLNTIQLISVALLPMLFAIVVHEVAHGLMAKRLGDSTAAMLGRLTLNPFKHIDPVGTILVPIVMIATVGIAFGWAKPVPIDYRNLHNPKRDMVLVAVAGPASNLLMAFAWAIIGRIATSLPDTMAYISIPLIFMGMIGILINIALMVINLIPIPPLDGGRVAVGLLPAKPAHFISKIEPYGIIIFVVLIMTGILGKVIWPVITSISGLLNKIAGF